MFAAIGIGEAMVTAELAVKFASLLADGFLTCKWDQTEVDPQFGVVHPAAVPFVFQYCCCPVVSIGSIAAGRYLALPRCLAASTPSLLSLDAKKLADRVYKD